MKKLRFIAILLVLAVAGYMLGRATVTKEVPGVIVGEEQHEIPLFPAPPKPDEKVVEAPPKPDHEVIIETPEEGTRPPAPSFTVTGRAKAGSGDVRIRVTAADGSSLFDQTASVNAGSGEPFGRFTTEVVLAEAPTANVTVTVNLVQGTDGNPPEEVSRIVIFGVTDEVTVKVYFPNAELGSNDNCEAVFPLERGVSGRTAIYRAAIEALLAGPNADEVAGGYLTSIPAGVKLKSVAADANGVVTADFDDRLDRNVAGSCRVGSIRSQIAATLKQFPEVREVVISVNGDSEEALQP